MLTYGGVINLVQLATEQQEILQTFVGAAWPRNGEKGRGRAGASSSAPPKPAYCTPYSNVNNSNNKVK